MDWEKIMPYIGGALRAALGVMGGYAIAKGWITPENWEPIAAGASAFAIAIWSAWKSYLYDIRTPGPVPVAEPAPLPPKIEEAVEAGKAEAKAEAKK